MKQILATIITLGTLLSGVMLVQPAGAAPVDILNNPQSCQGNTSICGDSGDGVFGLIKTIINVLLIVGSVVAVIMIIVGGITYTTSAGDPAKVKKAKDTVLYSIVGLVVSILAFSVVNFVIGKI